MKGASSTDSRKNAENPPGPLGIDDWATQTIDGAGLITIDVTASDSFEVRTRIWDKMSWLVSTGGR